MDKPPSKSSHNSEIPERGGCLELLNRHGWNLYFALFPNFEDGKLYRVYKCGKPEENHLLGAGKTPDEAISGSAGVHER